MSEVESKDIDEQLKQHIAEAVSIGCEDYSSSLGFKVMPNGYALMLDPDRMGYFWLRYDGVESGVHVSKWAICRGALANQEAIKHIKSKCGSKATKYDWTNVPPEVKFITTDLMKMTLCWAGNLNKSDLITHEDPFGGCIWFLTDEYLHNSFLNSRETTFSQRNGSLFGVKAYKGDWRDSLEERPEGV